MDLPADSKLHQVGTEFAKQWVATLKAGNELNVFRQMTTAWGPDGAFTFASPVLRGSYNQAKFYDPILQSIPKVLEKLTYVQVFVGTDKASNTARVALHFTTEISHEGKQFFADGIDLFVVDGDSGKATSLKVLIRPITALKAVQEKMHANIEAYIKKQRSKL
eukprot:TRINITY_DN51338_c0_g1_i1.p1 TRINITY_DN51338_c0_g1~~TRINITY_DN51338_c0_g1_i1.p1  ORF type:complete len:163 (+),score=67.13 TRINITY_DN51338_c0_g1_i1:72-560(+)